MSDPKKILGEFISYEEKEYYGVNKYVIVYKQPNSQDPSKEWKHQAIEADLSDEAVNMLISLSAGERFCVHQDKDEKGYPVIVNLTDAKDAPAKFEGQKTFQKKGDWKPKDESGVAVGAAWTNAIEIVKLLKIEYKDGEQAINDIAITASKILKLKLEQEDKLKAQKAANQNNEAKAEEKPKSRAELLKEKKEQEAKNATKKTETKVESKPEPESDLVDDELDDVVFE